MTNPLFNEGPKVQTQEKEVIQEKPFKEVETNDLKKQFMTQTSSTTDIIVGEVTTNELSTMALRIKELEAKPETYVLARTIDYTNKVSVLEFGQEAAREISTVSDRLLKELQSGHLLESTKLINSLQKIMKEFDLNELKPPKKAGFLGNIMGRAQRKIEQLVNKYNGMSRDVDRVYGEITNYESRTKSSITQLQHLYEENKQFYNNLEMHIAALNLNIEKIQSILPEKEKLAQENQEAAFEYENLKEVLELMEKRKYNLVLSQQVAFQSAPEIMMLQQNNTALLEQISTSFVVTLPAFKTALVKALTIRQQQGISGSMKEMNKMTNQLLQQNANNTVKAAIETARMSNDSVIEIQTIENNWKTITDGMKTVSQIQSEGQKKRVEGYKRIEQLQLEYDKLKK